MIDRMFGKECSALLNLGDPAAGDVLAFGLSEQDLTEWLLMCLK